MDKKIYLLLPPLLALHFFLLINLRFTAWPEVVSFPYLFNNGFRLYSDFVHAYTPLLTLSLSGLYKIFGYSLPALKIFTWVLILTNDILIFLIAKKLTGQIQAGLLALLFYVVTQPFLDGNMLWFDSTLTTPILLAIYFFETNLFLSGFFMAIAVLTKQTAFIFVGATSLLLIYLKAGLKKLLAFTVPTIFLGGVFLVYLWITDELAWFYNWNLYFPFAYWTKYPAYEIISLTKRELLTILLVLSPAALIFITRLKKMPKNRKSLTLFLFLFAGIIAVYPRFSFYHFQPALAISAIIFGYATKELNLKRLVIIVYLLVVAGAIALPTLKFDWQKETRFWGEEETRTALLLREKIPAEESIYLLGPHSLYYVLAERLPPKPWLDNYGWYFEIPGMQDAVIELWENDPPNGVVIQNPAKGNWYDLGVYRPQKILDWVNKKYDRREEIKPGLWLWLKNK